MIKNFFLLIFLFVFTTSSSLSNEFLKPNIKYKPLDVVKIQLSALKSNDVPYKNAGIKQTWEFAHPSNKKFTGPLPRFIKLLNRKGYNILLNHVNHEIVEVFKSEKKFIYEVTVLNSEKYFFKYNWEVEKYKDGGYLNNCWLTTAVSLPKSIGSSI